MNIALNVVIVAVFLINNVNCDESTNDSISGVRLMRTGPKPPWNETYLDKLRNDLLTNYDKYARPGQHYDVTTVQIGISVTYLETDELNSTISVASWLKLFWSDTKLKWNKEDYGGIDVIKMADHEVWQPDIYLYNSACGGEAVTRYGNPYALVYSDGKVLWVPPSTFTALCEFDLYYWPFDTQQCYLRFASWSHSGKEIQLTLFESKYADLEHSVVMSPWLVNSSGEVTSVHHDCCPDAFYNVQFNLTLTRKSSSYVAVVVTPIVAVVTLILIQCCLPSHSGERIILTSCTAIMVTMLLTYFTQKMSAMGSHTPWIVTFYSTSLYIVAVSIAESIFVLLLLKTERKKALPWNIKKHLQGRLGTLLLLKHSEPEYYATGQNPPAEEMKNYHSSEFEDKIGENDVIVKPASNAVLLQEWEILAIAIDRMSFVLYFAMYFILILCYII